MEFENLFFYSHSPPTSVAAWPKGLGLWTLTCGDCGFESRWRVNVCRLLVMFVIKIDLMRSLSLNNEETIKIKRNSQSPFKGFFKVLLLYK
jgi:hypothetical protein